MRETVLRAGEPDFDVADDADERPSRLRLTLAWLARRPVDTAAALVAAGGVVTILVNALFLQSGPHPAPIFANKPLPVPVANHSLTPADAALTRPRPAETVATPLPPARPRNQVVADIQRELSRRGFYDGPTDGVYGPKTDAAIRDFEHSEPWWATPISRRRVRQGPSMSERSNGLGFFCAGVGASAIRRGYLTSE